MCRWSLTARKTIQEVHASLPDTATLDERIKAVDAAYPFGLRQFWPYKAWLKARREYLHRYGYQSKGKPMPPLFESPMERIKRLSLEASHILKEEG